MRVALFFAIGGVSALQPVAFVRRASGAAPLHTPLFAATRARPVRLAEPLAEQLRQELPSAALLKALDRCGGRVTAADAAIESGQDIIETRRQLLVLARLVGGEMQVSPEGELVFVFTEGSLRRQLRAASIKARASDAWGTVSPSLFWLLRASFGLALLTSLTVVITGVTVLSQSKDDNSGRYSSALPMARMWGPHPLDFLYYSRPYYRYNDDPQEMGFLQSCFSFLFGDADPNSDFQRRTSLAVAALIRQVRRRRTPDLLLEAL